MEDTTNHGKLSLHLPTEQEKLEWDFEKEKRMKYIARARSAVVRKQIVEAYEILDRIDFDYVSDTAFRDCIVGSMKELERALNDFLLDDTYHKSRIEAWNKMSLDDFKEWKNQMTVGYHGAGKVVKSGK